MTDETRSIGPICADLEAKGEKEAAFVLDRVANANAELGEENVELTEKLEGAIWSLNLTVGYMPDGVEKERVITHIDKLMRFVYGELEEKENRNE